MTLPKLNNDIIELIAKNLIKNEYKLLDWIDINNINYISLNFNYNSISFLKENQNKINWHNLSRNINAIELLKENPDKIISQSLSSNPGAIELLKENQNKIDWDGFSLNSSIFTYDYKKIKQNFEVLGEEIIAKALHPKRIFRLIEEYGEDQIYNTYFDDD
jgi:hypothetical protein